MNDTHNHKNKGDKNSGSGSSNNNTASVNGPASVNSPASLFADFPAPANKQAKIPSDKVVEKLSYVAHFSSPLNATSAKGFFEFESTARASSKQNHHDARVKMLEIYGKEAIAWVIDEVKLKKKNPDRCVEQLELDFRERKPARKRPVAKKYL